MEFLIQRLNLAVASAIQQNCSILSNKSLGDLITIISAKKPPFVTQLIFWPDSKTNQNQDRSGGKDLTYEFLQKKGAI